MQIRCYSCSMPISIGRASVEYALNVIEEDDLVYFDFRCPKCKKSNSVSKEKLLHASPAWVYEPTGRELEKEEELKKESTTAKKSVPDKKDQEPSAPKKAPAKKSPAVKSPAKAAPAKKTRMNPAACRIQGASWWTPAPSSTAGLLILPARVSSPGAC